MPMTGRSARASLPGCRSRRDRRSLAAAGKLLLVGRCALLMLLAAGQVQAGPLAPDDGCLTDIECKGHYDQAVKLFEEGRFETALPAFQAAYQKRQMPWLLINIGRTLHRLGRSREALDHYERFKQAETKADIETQERLEKYIAQARALTESATPPLDPTAAQPAPEGSRPLYKKWWFWTAIGGGVVAITIIGIAAGVAANQSPGLPSGVPRVMFSF